MAVVTTNLGTVTAYGDAVAAGYTGTKEEWQALMADYAENVPKIEQNTADIADLKGAIDGSVEDYINDWLDSHPEATTTVQDGALTEPKFADSLKLKTIKDYVTPQMFGAVGDGVTDDIGAFNSAIAAMNSGQVLYVPPGDYLLGRSLSISKNIKLVSDGVLHVSHSNPVIVLDGLTNAIIDINAIEKTEKVFDYTEGAHNYSIGIVVKNCDGCIITANRIINTTTAFVLLAETDQGCHYNKISCDNAQTFTGIELIRSNTGGWVNGNTISKFRWMVNTWFDNTELVAAYMIKSLSYAKSNETDPYMNNANKFDGLIAEYGAQAADYPILLVRLDYARGYTFSFDRVEILAKNSSLSDNSFYFTNSVFCIANVLFNLSSYTSSIGDLGTDHNAVYIKQNYEALLKNGIDNITANVTLHESLSYTNYWFYVIKKPATRTVKICGELTATADINSGSIIISNLPKCRLGYGKIQMVMGSTATMWNPPTGVTYYKISIGGNGTKIDIRGAVNSGTRLYVDFEYVADDSEFN